MLIRAIILTCFSLCLPHLATAGDHLTPGQLVTLVSNPDLRPTFESDGRTYVSGGIGILVYDGANAMDALGPFQVFKSAGLRPILVSASRNEKGKYKLGVTFSGRLEVKANRTIANTKDLEVLVIPGGLRGTINIAQDQKVLNWIKAIDKKTIYTTSVCTGSWILGATGLLKGKKATSNWYRADELLTHFGAIPQSNERYIFDGKIITANGVTAGIDMALAIVKKVFAHDRQDGKDYTQGVMLDMQYDPHPPVIGGSLENTEPVVFTALQELYDFYEVPKLVKAIPVP